MGGLPVREMAETCGVSCQSRTLATLRPSPRREDPNVVNLRARASQQPQRDTLLQIFQEKTNHNVEWHDVMSLLEAVGSVEQQHDDMFVFRLGQETEVLRRPSEKDIDGQQLVDLRRILTSGGYDTIAADLEDKGNES